jgi:CII-binding regulator of phage lambda lysogenization HflD
VGIRPLTDDGLYELLDALGFDTSHRAHERAQLERRVLQLEDRLEASEETVEALWEHLRRAERENATLEARLKMVKSATADA